MRFLNNKGLDWAFIFLFEVSIIGKIFWSMSEHNKKLFGQSLSLALYLCSGYFIESTFENWESDFLQKALFN